jgi:hypothetical protein
VFFEPSSIALTNSGAKVAEVPAAPAAAGPV